MSRACDASRRYALTCIECVQRCLTCVAAREGDLLDNVPASPKRGEEHSQSGGMFSGLEFSSENPASAQAQEPADLLGGPTPQAVQPPSAPQASSSMSDPFSNFQGTPIAQGPAEPISDLFGGMSMGQSSQQTPSADNGDLLGAMEPLASTAAAPGSSNQGSSPHETQAVNRRFVASVHFFVTQQAS